MILDHKRVVLSVRHEDGHGYRVTARDKLTGAEAVCEKSDYDQARAHALEELESKVGARSNVVPMRGGAA